MEPHGDPPATATVDGWTRTRPPRKLRPPRVVAEGSSSLRCRDASVAHGRGSVSLSPPGASPSRAHALGDAREVGRPPAGSDPRAARGSTTNQPGRTRAPCQRPNGQARRRGESDAPASPSPHPAADIIGPGRRLDRAMPYGSRRRSPSPGPGQEGIRPQISRRHDMAWHGRGLQLSWPAGRMRGAGGHS